MAKEARRVNPLAIDLFCGLGGWTEGLLAEGYRVIGFDIERHAYGSERYPAQLVIQDVLTIHGSRFKGADLIVASPPCQEFSYMAMPWTRAKQIAKGLRGEGDFPEGYKGSRTRKELTALFDACFRIQREASAAAGRHIPMVVENVRGACPWVGKSRWNFGSFHLWGDVPVLMPIAQGAQKFNPDGTAHPPGSWFAVADSKNRGANSEAQKVPGFRFDGSGRSFQTASVEGTKAGGSWSGYGEPGYVAKSLHQLAAEAQNTIAHVNKRDGHSHTRHLTNQRKHDAVRDGLKHGGDWFSDPDSPSRQGGMTSGVKQAGICVPRANGKGDAWFQDGAARHGSKSTARKAASAQIAKIPIRLSRWIAAYYKPAEERTA